MQLSKSGLLDGNAVDVATAWLINNPPEMLLVELPLEEEEALELEV